MATRYYLPISGAPPVSPGYDSSWNDTVSGGTRIRMVSAKSSTALTDQSISTAPADITIFKQYVSDQIGVVNFNATTVSWVIRGSCSLTSAFPKATLRLYHTGGTFTDLLAAATFDTNFPATAATRIKNAVTLLNVTSQNNDRIVFEIGSDNQSAGNRTVVERFGDNNASDFALTSGLTTDLNPWIEFSAAIPAPGGPSSGFFNLMK